MKKRAREVHQLIVSEDLIAQQGGLGLRGLLQIERGEGETLIQLNCLIFANMLSFNSVFALQGWQHLLSRGLLQVAKYIKNSFDKSW